MKAAFYTLGCKVNQYETQLMKEALISAGYEIVDIEENADVYVINSCTVTAASNQKTRQSLRAIKRAHPDSLMVLAGCMSQAYPKQAQALTQADIIIGNTEHKHLAALIEKKRREKQRVIAIEAHQNSETFESGIITSFAGKTRAEVKIEDGCNRFCTYCAIPYARGRVRSKPLAQIEAEITALAAAGYQEVVLVGINLSAYNDNGADLADAAACAAAVPGIARVRLGSLEPAHMSDDMLAELRQNPAFCPQFHISLQSGCDTTLKAMNRHYTAEEYFALCQKLRSSFPDCTLTTDVMVGFPGESEEDFEASLAFVKSVGFEKLHVFPYSVREGTKAATMPGQLPKAVKAERAKRMIALGEQLREEFFKAQRGREYPVLFETFKNGEAVGHTGNYIPVSVKSEADLQNTVHTVKLTGYTKDYCIGSII